MNERIRKVKEQIKFHGKVLLIGTLPIIVCLGATCIICQIASIYPKLFFGVILTVCSICIAYSLGRIILMLIDHNK